MMKNQHAYLGVVLCASVLAGVVQAQETSLWKVINTVTPTMVPIYAGQPSPFPEIKLAKMADPSMTEENMRAEESKRRARVMAMSSAKSLMEKEVRAIVPNISALKVAGTTNGVSGYRVLIGDSWYGLGQKIGLPMSISAEMSAAIDNVKMYDIEAGQSIESEIQNRLAQKAVLDFEITAISKKSIKLINGKRVAEVPLDTP